MTFISQYIKTGLVGSVLYYEIHYKSCDGIGIKKTFIDVNEAKDFFHNNPILVFKMS